MNSRKDVLAELNKLLHSFTEHSTRLISSLEKWDPLTGAVQQLREDVCRIVPLVKSLIAEPSAIDSGYHFIRTRKPLILYVDDNTNRLNLLRSVLEGHGYHVLTAEYGRKGLELFLSQDVELVILDFHMPGMNGEEVAQKMRQFRPAVPILIFSGSLTLPDRVIATVDGFISTSEEPEVLLERVGTMLGRARAKAS